MRSESHASPISHSTENGITHEAVLPLSEAGARRANIGRRRANAMDGGKALLNSPSRAGHSSRMAQIFQDAGLNMQQDRENLLTSPRYARPFRRHTSIRNPSCIRGWTGGGWSPSEVYQLDTGQSRPTGQQVRRTDVVSYPILDSEIGQQLSPAEKSRRLHSLIRPTYDSGIILQHPSTATPTTPAAASKTADHNSLQQAFLTYTTDQSTSTPSRETHKHGHANVIETVGLKDSTSTGSWSGDSDFFQPQAAARTDSQRAPVKAGLQTDSKRGSQCANAESLVTFQGRHDQNDITEWWHRWIHRTEHVVKWLENVEITPPYTAEVETKLSLEHETPSTKILTDDLPWTTVCCPSESGRNNSARSSSTSTSRSADHKTVSVLQRFHADWTLTGPEMVKLLTPKRQRLPLTQAHCGSETDRSAHAFSLCESSEDVQLSRSRLHMPTELQDKVDARKGAGTNAIGIDHCSKETEAQDPCDRDDSFFRCSIPLESKLHVGEAGDDQGSEKQLLPLSPDVEVHRGTARRRARREDRKRCPSYYDTDIIRSPVSP